MQIDQDFHVKWKSNASTSGKRVIIAKNINKEFLILFFDSHLPRYHTSIR